MTCAIPTAAGRRPLTGHAGHLDGDTLGFMEHLLSYGPIVRVFVGPRPVYVVNSPQLMREVFVVQSKAFDKGAMFDTLRKPLGNGLVTSKGDFHRRQRRLVQPAFHSDRIARYGDHMAECCAAQSTLWRAGERLELVKEINRLVLRVLMRTLYAAEPPAELQEAVKGWLAVKYESLRLVLSARVAWADRIRVLPGWRAPDAGPFARLQAVQQEIIDRYRADGRDHGDLLSMLILAEGPDGVAMDDAEILDELITLYLSATGTVASVLAWTLHEVANRPEVERRVHEEASRALAGGPLSFGALSELGYTRQVVKEALRMYPSSWLSMRRAQQAVSLGGHAIPAGADLFLNTYGMQRDPRYYDEPDRFDPDRHSVDAPAVPKQAFLPFGGGSRMCLGEGYAWALLMIAVATFVGQWRLVPADGEPVRARVGTVLRPERLAMTPILRVATSSEVGSR